MFWADIKYFFVAIMLTASLFRSLAIMFIAPQYCFFAIMFIALKFCRNLNESKDEIRLVINSSSHKFKSSHSREFDF
jgi:hypothetical protein